jgi:hypothetical protein
MSTEFDVWANDRRSIDIAELATVAERWLQPRTAEETPGNLYWNVLIVRNHRSWEDFDTVQHGHLLDGDLVVGWIAEGHGDPDNARILTALRDKKAGSIEDWYKQKILCTTLMLVSNAPDWGAGERDEAMQAYGKEYVAARTESKVRYTIRTSMGRHEGDLILQCLVPRWIMELRGGMFEDPQSGRFDFDVTGKAPR